VPVGNKSALVASFVLHIKNEVNTNLLVTIGGLSSFAQVPEGLILMELGHLKGSRVLPLGIPITLVKLDGMVIVAWDFVTILVAWCHLVGPQLDLDNHPEKLLVPSCNDFQPSKSSRFFSLT